MNREAIYVALADRIFAATGVAATFATRARFLRHHVDVSPEQMPALYIFQTGESWRRPGKGVPPVRTLRCHVVLYVYAGGADSGSPDVLPATLCNAVLDAIDGALSADDVPTKTVDLGGLVEHVYIEGDVVIAEGLLQNTSIVDVPVTILVP